MPISTTQPTPGIGTAGTGLLLLLDAGAIEDTRKPTTTELAAGKDITYLITGDGFERTAGQDEIEDDRLTLPQSLKLPGTKTDEASLTYPFGQEGSLDTLLEEGKAYILAYRPAVKHSEPIAADQAFVVIPFTCGRKAEEPPAKNSVWRKKVKLNIAGEVIDEAIVTGDTA